MGGISLWDTLRWVRDLLRLGPLHAPCQLLRFLDLPRARPTQRDAIASSTTIGIAIGAGM